MTYSELEALIERIAIQTQAGIGHFHCGTDITLEKAVEEKGYPVIYLDPITGERALKEGPGMMRANITLGFFEQGGEGLSAEERRAIFARQEAISTRFFLLLEEEELDFAVVRDSLIHKYTAQHLSGIACTLTIKAPLELCY